MGRGRDKDVESYIYKERKNHRKTIKNDINRTVGFLKNLTKMKDKNNNQHPPKPPNKNTPKHPNKKHQQNDIVSPHKSSKSKEMF